MVFDVQHVLMFGLQAVIFLIYAALTVLLVRFLRQTNDHSRYILLMIAIMGCIGAAITGVKMLVSEDFLLTESLYRWRIMGCLMACEFMILYPYEFKHPLKLPLWEIILLMLPGHIFFLLFFCCGIDYRQLATPEDIWMHLNEFNVYIRIIPIILMTVSWIVAMPAMVRWFDEPESFWPKAYVIVGLINGLCFTFALISGNIPSLLAYKLCFGFLFPIFIGYDLYNRYNLRNQPESTISYESLTTEEEKSEPVVDEYFKFSENLIEVVWNRFEEVMEKDALWSDPRLTYDQLVRKLGTNHTYLSEALKEHTGYTFTEYINRRRIHFVDEEMHHNPKKNIQDVFVEAGYSSRSTAWRNYKLYSETQQKA